MPSVCGPEAPAPRRMNTPSREGEKWREFLQRNESSAARSSHLPFVLSNCIVIRPGKSDGKEGKPPGRVSPPVFTFHISFLCSPASWLNQGWLPCCSGPGGCPLYCGLSCWSALRRVSSPGWRVRATYPAGGEGGIPQRPRPAIAFDASSDHCRGNRDRVPALLSRSVQGNNPLCFCVVLSSHSHISHPLTPPLGVKRHIGCGFLTFLAVR